MNIKSRKAIEIAVEIAGGQEALAKQVRALSGHSLTQGAVSQWVHGVSCISQRYFAALVKIGRGEFTVEHLVRDNLAAAKERAA